jgi:hypothetical protein
VSGVETIQAIVVTLVAVLPGALYTWSFEREVGNWGVSLSDRLLRFVGFSAIFHALFSYPEYLFWSHYLHRVAVVHGIVRVENPLANGGRLPWWLFVMPVLYVGAPMIAGFLTARGAIRGDAWSRLLVGRNPQPRAWDRLFWASPSFIVRLRLKNEAWIGGLFGADSYASGYPEPQDLLLETTYQTLPDGSFAADEGGELVDLDSSVLISWEDVHFLEVFPQISSED